MTTTPIVPAGTSPTAPTAPTVNSTTGAGTACGCPRRILGPAAVAALLDISERHLTDLRAEDPTFPTPRMCGRLPRWDAETIIAWVAAAAGTIDGAGSSVPGQEPNGRPDSQVQEHRPDAPTPSTRRGRRHGGAGLV